MDIQKDTEMKEITVNKVTLKVPQPYKEGDTLRANEADVINQTLSENLRNNFASRVKAAVEEAGGDASNVDTKALQKELNAYVAEYDFGVRRAGGGGGVKLSPVEREALNIAKETVKAAIRKQGMKITDVPAAKITELANDLVGKNPEITAEAERRVQAKQSVAADSIDLGDITTESASEEQSA